MSQHHPGPPHSPYQPPQDAFAANDSPAPHQGLARAALVAGIAAFLLGWLPVLGLLAGGAAIVLAIRASRAGAAKGMWITGLVLGSLAALTSLITTVSLFSSFGDDAADPAAAPAAIDAPAAPAEEAAAPTVDQAALDRAEADRVAAEEADRVAAEEAAAAEAAAAEQAAAEEAARVEAERVAAEQAAAEEAARVEAERAAAEQAAADAAAAEAAKGTVSQQNAYESARDYLDFSAFSRAGLIQQLTSEYGSGFPAADAEFAIERLEAEGGVDWNAEAAEAAKDYLEFSSFSRSGLLQQLTSEFGSQFTPAQAEYGVSQTGL